MAWVADPTSGLLKKNVYNVTMPAKPPESQKPLQRLRAVGSAKASIAVEEAKATCTLPEDDNDEAQAEQQQHVGRSKKRGRSPSKQRLTKRQKQTLSRPATEAERVGAQDRARIKRQHNKVEDEFSNDGAPAERKTPPEPKLTKLPARAAQPGKLMDTPRRAGPRTDQLPEYVLDVSNIFGKPKYMLRHKQDASPDKPSEADFVVGEENLFDEGDGPAITNDDGDEPAEAAEVDEGDAEDDDEVDEDTKDDDIEVDEGDAEEPDDDEVDEDTKDDAEAAGVDEGDAEDEVDEDTKDNDAEAAEGDEGDAEEPDDEGDEDTKDDDAAAVERQAPLRRRKEVYLTDQAFWQEQYKLRELETAKPSKPSQPYKRPEADFWYGHGGLGFSKKQAAKHPERAHTHELMNGGKLFATQRRTHEVYEKIAERWERYGENQECVSEVATSPTNPYSLYYSDIDHLPSALTDAALQIEVDTLIACYGDAVIGCFLLLSEKQRQANAVEVGLHIVLPDAPGFCRNKRLVCTGEELLTIRLLKLKRLRLIAPELTMEQLAEIYDLKVYAQGENRGHLRLNGCPKVEACQEFLCKEAAKEAGHIAGDSFCERCRGSGCVDYGRVYWPTRVLPILRTTASATERAEAERTATGLLKTVQSSFLKKIAISRIRTLGSIEPVAWRGPSLAEAKCAARRVLLQNTAVATTTTSLDLACVQGVLDKIGVQIKTNGDHRKVVAFVRSSCPGAANERAYFKALDKWNRGYKKHYDKAGLQRLWQRSAPKHDVAPAVLARQLLKTAGLSAAQVGALVRSFPQLGKTQRSCKREEWERAQHVMADQGDELEEILGSELCKVLCEIGKAEHGLGQITAWQLRPLARVSGGAVHTFNKTIQLWESSKSVGELATLLGTEIPRYLAQVRTEITAKLEHTPQQSLIASLSLLIGTAIVSCQKRGSAVGIAEFSKQQLVDIEFAKTLQVWHEDLLSVFGGFVVNLRTGEKSERVPPHRFTGQTPVPYTPWAELKKRWPEKVRQFEAVSTLMLGGADEESARLFKDDPRYQEMVARSVELKKCIRSLQGYSVTGSTKHKLLVLLLNLMGNGGKSSYTKRFTAALGPDFAFDIKRELMMVNKDARRFESPEAPSTAKMRFKGRRVGFVQEVKRNCKIEEEFVKGVTGFDPMSGRDHHVAEGNFPTFVKVWICANDTPQMPHDPSLLRRMLLIEWPTEFVPEGEPLTKPTQRRAIDKVDEWWRDPEFNEIMLSDLVESAKEYYAGGEKIHKPSFVLASSKRLRDDTDKLAEILPKYTVNEPEGKVLFKLLLDTIKQKHSEYDTSALKIDLLKKAYTLERTYYDRQHRKDLCVIGMRPKTTADEETEIRCPADGKQERKDVDSGLLAPRPEAGWKLQ